VRTVGVLLYDEVEVLDACGPFEVFTTASRVAERRGQEPPFRVVTISAHDRHLVHARAGLRLTADHLLADAPQLDVVLVPGGVHEAVQHDPVLLTWLRQVASSAEVVASVCTGAFVLGRIGLLDGIGATTHWEDLEDLKTAFPEVRVVEGIRYVDAGRVVTSGGISAGIDMAVHLVRRLVGEDHARLTARQMDYAWDPSAGR
jgi:transcriptional regulator GlxA family with amidase domain